MKMWRQGDVLIVEDHRDDRRNYQRANSDVLVYGEATGHAHRVNGDDVTVFDLGQDKYIEASQGFSVVHEEHDTIEIPEGFYKVVRQREFDGEHIRMVYD